MRGENMVQKGNFKDVLVMKGMGRVNDTRPIDLQYEPVFLYLFCKEKYNWQSNDYKKYEIQN